MRVEYSFSLDRIQVPRFSVETTEGPHKLFTLTTLVLNVLAECERADVIFHSPNQADLPKKIAAFKKILQSGPAAPGLAFGGGPSGSLGSCYYSRLNIRPSSAPA